MFAEVENYLTKHGYPGVAIKLRNIAVKLDSVTGSLTEQREWVLKLYDIEQRGMELDQAEEYFS